MKHQQISHLIAALSLLTALLISQTSDLRAQAIVLSNSPAFTPLNLSRSREIAPLNIEVTYSMEWHNVGQKIRHKDLRTIQIARDVVISRNTALYLADSTATAMIKKGAKGVKMFNDPVIPFDIKLDRKAKTYRWAYRIPYDRMHVRYEAPIPALKWQIHNNQTKKIIGYDCQYATATFQGKELKAWYAKDLPYNVGPYYFGGLPGLILELSIDQTNWKAIGLRKAKQGEQIKEFGRPVKDMKKGKAIEFVRNIYVDPVSFFSSLGVECYSSENPDVKLSNDKIKWDAPALLLVEQ